MDIGESHITLSLGCAVSGAHIGRLQNVRAAQSIGNHYRSHPNDLPRRFAHPRRAGRACGMGAEMNDRVGAFGFTKRRCTNADVFRRLAEWLEFELAQRPVEESRGRAA